MQHAQPPFVPLSKTDKIYVAGHRGMVGSAVWLALEARGYANLVGRTRQELDLRDARATLEFFRAEQPKAVVDAAARVGGILANSSDPFGFLMENLQIQNSLICAAFTTDVPKFLFLGSSCIYPKLAPQPLKEEYLLTGPLEPTNEGYALAKIAGVKACEAARTQHGKDYLSLMPTNLYGPGDNFELETSHVLPALIRKFHEAKENNHAPVTLWGSGTPMREFLHVDDLARAVVFALERPMAHSIYNVGTGKDLAIKDLALLVQEVVGHKGDIVWDRSKPDGTPRKVLDVGRMEAEGWISKFLLVEGLKSTYEWFQLNHPNKFK